MSSKYVPSFDDLPMNPGDPPNSAWALWPENPELGALNYLTDDMVLRAAKEEIQTGERVGLNLPLDYFTPPLLGRAGFEQKIIDKDPLVVNDDVITFNTQGSSQWDSFRHFAYQNEKRFYKGATQADIHAKPPTSLNGLQSWSTRCIAGRAVLIDYAEYASRSGKVVDSFRQHPISLFDIQSIANSHNIIFQRGDILLLRTGYVSAYSWLTPSERSNVASVREWIGLAQGEDTTRWLWERQFAAVASDSPGFECRPPTDAKWHLHPILLAGWGTPIGELFDLDGLAEICRRRNKWSFFLTSAPLNYEGAVASPPNAVAIF